MNSIQPQNPFDTMRQTTPEGGEFWSARDLMSALGYSKWQKFSDALDRAQASCTATGHSAENHFLPAPVKSTGGRPQEDFHLSRYACYLTAMNGDPRKPEIAAAQAYFVQQTRKAEMQATQTATAAALITARAIAEATRHSTNSLNGILKRRGIRPTHHYFEPLCGAPAYLYPLSEIQAQFPSAHFKAFEGEALEGTRPVAAVVEKIRATKAALPATKQPRLLPTTDSLSLARELVQIETRRAEILSALGGAA